MGYALDFLLCDFSFAVFDCGCVEFVDVALLVVGFYGLDGLIDDSLFLVGVHT